MITVWTFLISSLFHSANTNWHQVAAARGAKNLLREQEVCPLKLWLAPGLDGSQLCETIPVPCDSHLCYWEFSSNGKGKLVPASTRSFYYVVDSFNVVV